MWVPSHVRALCLVAATLVVAVSVCWLPTPTRGQDAPSLLADASVNKDWHVARDSGMMLYMGEDREATPRLALNRQACGGRFLQMTIESNVNSVMLSSGESQLTLAAPAERRMTLTLDSVSDPPRLVLDHEALAEQQGRWVKLLHHESDEQIVVSFLGATYANVTLDGDKRVEAVSASVPAESDPGASVAPVEPQIASTPFTGPFVEARPLYEPIPGDFPTLRIPMDRRPSATLSAVRRLERGVFNKIDGGTGVISERVQVGTRGSGILQYPVFQTVTRPNPENPYGLNANRRQLAGLFERVAAEVARIDRADEKHQEALDDARRALADFTGNNWTGLELTLNAASRNALHNPHAQLGQAVVAIGTLLGKNPIKQAPAASWAVRLSENTEHVLAVDPVLFNASPGQKVMVGGLLAGFVNDAEVGLTPVLQNVFLVTPDHEAAEARLKRRHGV